MHDPSHESPFPGMDPYLEARWGDVHTTMIVHARGALQSRLPDGLVARIEEYVSLYFATGTETRLRPDVRVVETRDLGDTSGAPAAVAVAEPVVVPRRETETLRVLKVLDTTDDERVVTSIELLSPANKSLAGGEEFRRKQESLLRGGVNLVEVDLLRHGHYVLSAPLEFVPRQYQSPYRACIIEALAPEVANVYHFSLRERLPAIGIPLREGDAPLPLDLQALVDRAYRDGMYQLTDYTRDPRPPLDADDAAWADELLRAAGRR